MHKLLGKKRLFNKSKLPSRCHNPQKTWTPQQPFQGKQLNPVILYQILSVETLRNTTVRRHYGYFGCGGLGWQGCFTRQTQMIKILLCSNGTYSLYMSLQKWLLSRKPEIILLSYEISLINDNDFLLLYPSYITQNSDLPFRTW